MKSRHWHDRDRAVFSSVANRPLVQRLRIGIATLLLVQSARLFSDCRNVGMIGTERFLAYCQRAFQQRLRYRNNDLGLGRSQQDCSAKMQHLDGPDRAPFPVSSESACATAPHRRNDLGRGIAPPDCSATLQHPDDRDRVPFRGLLARAEQAELLPNFAPGYRVG